MESATLTEPGRRAGRPSTAGAIAGAAWVGLVTACWGVGTALNAAGSPMLLGAPPLFGEWDLQLGLDLIVPGAVAAAVAIAGPRLARRLPWPGLLAATTVALAVWAVALAVTNGWHGLVGALDTRPEYLHVLPRIDSPGEFLSTFRDRVDSYPVHVRGHPPGMVLILLGLDRAGLGGAGPAAALIIAVGSTAPAAALIALRTTAGEDAARRAAPFMVLLPAAVYLATTADALYMGVGAWAVASVVVATGRRGHAADAVAVLGGVLFGVLIFLSYGLVLLASIPLAVAIAARRLRPILLAAAGGAAVVAAFLVAGFWWVDGLAEVREQYIASVARNRSYEFFLFNDLAAFALVLGPAVAVGLGRLRDRGAWLLVGGALAAVALADLSGMSKAEVERIWLPFVPWVALATSSLRAPRAVIMALLAAQAVIAIAIEAAVATPW